MLESKFVVSINKLRSDSSSDQPQPPNNLADVNSLIERGYIALECREWKKAGKLFEEVLKIEPKNADAFLGLSMIRKRYSVISDYCKCKSNLNKDKYFLLALKYANNDNKEKIQQIFDNTQKSHCAFKAKTKNIIKRICVISAICILVLSFGIGGYYGYVEYITPSIKYDEAKQLYADLKYEEAHNIFTSLGDYKDSAELSQETAYLSMERYVKNAPGGNIISCFEQASKYMNKIDSNYRDTRLYKEYIDARTLLYNVQYNLPEAYEKLLDCKKNNFLDSAEILKNNSYMKMINDLQGTWKKVSSAKSVPGINQTTLSLIAHLEGEDELNESDIALRKKKRHKTGDILTISGSFINSKPLNMMNNYLVYDTNYSHVLYRYKNMLIVDGSAYKKIK